MNFARRLHGCGRFSTSDGAKGPTVGLVVAGGLGEAGAAVRLASPSSEIGTGPN